MANDALDPGLDGTYPFWPRKPDGTENPERMPRGLYPQRSQGSGKFVITDQTPRYPVDDPLGRAGQPIVPPVIPPGGNP